MSSIYIVGKIRQKDHELQQEIDLLSQELQDLKQDLKIEFHQMKNNKAKLIRGSVDLDHFRAIDFKKDKLAEKQELDKLMKEYNRVDKGYRNAKKNKTISARMDYMKTNFDR